MFVLFISNKVSHTDTVIHTWRGDEPSALSSHSVISVDRTNINNQDRHSGAPTSVQQQPSVPEQHAGRGRQQLESLPEGTMVTLCSCIITAAPVCGHSGNTASHDRTSRWHKSVQYFKARPLVR